MLAMAVPEASKWCWQGHAELPWVRSPGCLPKVLGGPCWVLLRVATVLKATPFLNIGILQEAGPPHPSASAHVSSNEFTVWVVLFCF